MFTLILAKSDTQPEPIHACIAKFSQYYSEKNPTLQRKFRKIIAKFRYSIVGAIFAIVLRNFGEFFYGC